MNDESNIAPERVARHQYDKPRPGRSTCSAVESYYCLAPAGVRVGNRVGAVNGVRRSDLHTCAYCGEAVCQECSSDYRDHGRACDSHSPEELLRWLESPIRGADDAPHDA